MRRAVLKRGNGGLDLLVKPLSTGRLSMAEVHIVREKPGQQTRRNCITPPVSRGGTGLSYVLSRFEYPDFFFLRSLLRGTATLDLDLVNFHMQANYLMG